MILFGHVVEFHQLTQHTIPKNKDGASLAREM